MTGDSEIAVSINIDNHEPLPVQQRRTLERLAIVDTVEKEILPRLRGSSGKLGACGMQNKQH